MFRLNYNINNDTPDCSFDIPLEYETLAEAKTVALVYIVKNFAFYNLEVVVIGKNNQDCGYEIHLDHEQMPIIFITEEK